MFMYKTWLTTFLNEDLSLKEKRDLIAGAPFDPSNHSSASIVYTFYTEQQGNAWVFNFHPFYAWNGCSNQLLSLRFSGYCDVLEYYMCSPGATPFSPSLP
jgi:hypothetical protein